MVYNKLISKYKLYIYIIYSGFLITINVIQHVKKHEKTHSFGILHLYYTGDVAAQSHLHGQKILHVRRLCLQWKRAKLPNLGFQRTHRNWSCSVLNLTKHLVGSIILDLRTPKYPTSCQHCACVTVDDLRLFFRMYEPSGAEPKHNGEFGALMPCNHESRMANAELTEIAQFSTQRHSSPAGPHLLEGLTQNPSRCWWDTGIDPL